MNEHCVVFRSKIRTDFYKLKKKKTKLFQKMEKKSKKMILSNNKRKKNKNQVKPTLYVLKLQKKNETSFIIYLF